jgi:DNA-binding NtrC family response regulator
MTTAVRPVDTRASESTTPQRGTVLLVTGDADLREAASRVLNMEGYGVLTAAHAGHAVLACLKTARVGVAVIEMWMEDVSGPALADRLRRHSPDLRAIYVAQPGTPECAGILVRPFTREDLLAELTRSLSAASRQ